MAAIIRYKYIKQRLEVVCGCFYKVCDKVSHCKKRFDQRYYGSNKEQTCHQNIFTTKKGHMTQETTVVI